MKIEIEADDPPILIAANRALRALRVVLSVLIGLALAFGVPDAAHRIIETVGPISADSIGRAMGWIFVSPAAATVIVGLLVQCALSLRAGSISTEKAASIVTGGLAAVALVGAASLAAYSGLFAHTMSPDTFASTAFLSAAAVSAAALHAMRI